MYFNAYTVYAFYIIVQTIFCVCWHDWTMTLSFKTEEVASCSEIFLLVVFLFSVLWTLPSAEDRFGTFAGISFSF